MHEERKPLTSLFTAVIDEVVTLFQNEIRLVKAEMSEKFGRFANGGVMLAVGGVALIAALFMILLSIVNWLEAAGLPDEWGYLIVGGVLAAVGAFALMRGIRNVNPKHLVPERTIRDLKADINAVTEHVS
jgi:hypothetical protein